MKDLVTVLFVLVLGAGVTAGFFYWKNQQARAEEQAYEQSIDIALDNAIESFQLTPLRNTLADYQGDKAELLRTLYADPIKSDRLNLTYGNLQGDWPTTYVHLNQAAGSAAARVRLESEIDERFGAGAYDIMQSNYEQFLAANGTLTVDPARQANMWIFRDYLHRHGRYPIGPIRIENRQVVEAPASEPAQ